MASSGSMQSVHSSSNSHSQANLGVRHSNKIQAELLQVFPRREGNICAVPRGCAVKAAGRTKEKQAALGAEKLGGDESREVVAGGKLVARA